MHIGSRRASQPADDHLFGIRYGEPRGSLRLGMDLVVRGSTDLAMWGDHDLHGVGSPHELPARGDPTVDGDRLITTEREVQWLQLSRDRDRLRGDGRALHFSPASRTMTPLFEQMAEYSC